MEERKLASLFLIVSFILFGLGFFSLGSILFSEGIYQNISLKSDGWNYLSNLYSFPIKCIAAFLALFTISATLKRINQTKEQIELQGQQIRIVEENNQLSNYFKYYEEFQRYFRTVPKRIEYQKLIEQESFDQFFRPIYAHYHGAAYYKFQPSLTQTNNETLLKFLEDVSNSSLNKRGASFNLPLADEIALFDDKIEFNEIKILANNYIVSVEKRIGSNYDILYKEDAALFNVLPTFYKTYFYTEFVLAILNFEGIQHSFDFLRLWENEANFRTELKNKYNLYCPPKKRVKLTRRIHRRRNS